MSLADKDQAAADVAVAPRVSMADIEASIGEVYYRTGIECIEAGGGPRHGPLELLTMAFVVLKNGFVVVGQSACASPENYNKILGQRIALDDAKAKIWPLMGFALKERLHKEADSA